MSLANWRRALALLPLLALGAAAYAAPKTDVLTFRNGDRLTGEVKGLDRGKLSFDTEATGTIAIEWKDIAGLVSAQRLQLETEAGNYYLGPLVESASAGVLTVVADAGATDLPLIDVVRMTPIESAWLSRLDGDISAGYSFATANNQTAFNFEFNLEYQTEKLLIDLNADANTTNSTNNPETQRGNLYLQTYKLLSDRWFTGAVGQIERNEELGLDRRVSVGGGGGRFLKQTNSQVWRATGGLLYTRERFIESEAGTLNSAEGYMGLNFDWFRFDEPELDLSMDLTLFPSLTESGRWRSSYNVSLKWEIIKDFFMKLSLIGDYDSQPQDPTGTKSDYTLNTSLGWDF